MLHLSRADHFHCTLTMSAQAHVDGLRRVPVPPHRLTPLQQHWMQIYTPITTHLHLMIRMNVKARAVEIKVMQVPQFDLST